MENELDYFSSETFNFQLVTYFMEFLGGMKQNLNNILIITEKYTCLAQIFMA